MHKSLWLVYIILSCISLTSTALLYTYPGWKHCTFPKPPRQAGGLAPFRLLALGDPQLEGDSSLQDPHDPVFPSLRALSAAISYASSHSGSSEAVFQAVQELIGKDIPRVLRNARKRVDLFGNDFYLAHIYRSLHYFLKPTHVTVLGDLLGSQWIDEDEFGRRAGRFWNRVFRGGQIVNDATMATMSTEWLGADQSWASSLINIAGNHDIGYSGDLSRENVDRFERLFGKVNWAIKFRLATPWSNELYNGSALIPELWVIILNSMNLDTPAQDQDLQSETYKFVNDLISASYPVEDRTTATVVLTHVPLHKEGGICADAPFFDFYGSDEGSGLREQNHLSSSASRGILEGIYGMSGKPDAPAHGVGRNGIILDGHDHEGCDVYHHAAAVDEDNTTTRWMAERWVDSPSKLNRSIAGIREVTVRSMMGDYGGNAGLLSAWFDQDVQEWRFEYSTCSLGRQQVWWAVHVLDLVTIAVGLSYSILHLIQSRFPVSSSKLRFNYEAGVEHSQLSNSSARSSSVLTGDSTRSQLKRRTKDPSS